ncbi:MAG: carbohydrate ABC transporter permease [Jiangellaceae bacterium]
MSAATAAARAGEAVREPAPSAARGQSSTAAKVLLYVALVVFAVMYIYPFLIQLVTSVKTAPDAAANPLSLSPNPFTWAAFERLADTDFPLWFINSTWVAVLATLARILFNSMAGYALARISFRGRGGLFTAILAVMAVPGVVLLIPKFLVLNQVGMYNSASALVVPLAADAAGVFIMKQFFESIPVSVEEAARIDGAGTFRIFWSVVLPMARPALLTLTILAFQGTWNELPHFIVASQDPDLYTLTKGVATLTSGQLGAGFQFPITMAAALIMTIPVALLFFVFQRYFVRGATEGAVKG